MMRVRWFPLPEELAGNPYWSMLHASLTRLGVEFDSSPSPTGLGRRWLMANRGRVQVIHLHFVQPFYAYELTHARLRWVVRFARNLTLARGIGYRIVLTLHDLHPTYPLRPAWVDYLGHLVAVNLADRVIVHYQSASSLLTRRFGRHSNISVMPLPAYSGVYPNTILRTEARCELGYGDRHLVLVFFGGIRPNKGLYELIRAFRGIPGDNARLLIAGKPWPPETYVRELLHQASLDDRVRIVAEFVPDNQVQLYLNAADIVVLPFQQILTSSSAHLAMSFSRPVVAPCMGSLPDTVGQDAGVLYDPTDPEGLRRAMLSCVSMDLEAMGKRAYDRVQRFSFDDLARSTFEVYSGS